MPANIRLKFYKSAEKVRFENKFSGLCVLTPLTPKLDLSAVGQITARLKKSIGLVYANYAAVR